MSAHVGAVKGPHSNSPHVACDVWCSMAGVELRAFNSDADAGQSTRDGVMRTLDPLAARNLAALLVRGAEESERMRARAMPMEVDLDGHVDARGVKYLGKALRQPDGLYICLADVNGCLCRVEVRITPSDETQPPVNQDTLSKGSSAP